MSMYLPKKIWVFAWYYSTRLSHDYFFVKKKSSLLCRSRHVWNPAETRAKVLFKLFILWVHKEIIYFRIILKKHLDAKNSRKSTILVLVSLPSLFTWKRGRNKRTQKRVKSLKQWRCIWKHMILYPKTGYNIVLHHLLLQPLVNFPVKFPRVLLRGG